MRRGVAGLKFFWVLGSVLAVLAVAAPGATRFGPASGAAQDDGAEATATRAAEQAELADLRTQVAGLATEVARLEALGEPLSGRLGGSRAGFDAVYGRPTAFVGADQVGYEVPDIGRLTVTFADDAARRIVVSPERPADKPSNEPDPADWSLAEARDIARRFAPADAALDLEEEPTETEGDRLTGSGTSDALTAVTTLGADAGCATGAATFALEFTTPAPETVSAITLEPAPVLASAVTPPTVAADEEDEDGGDGGNAVANSSLGGVVTVNGVRVEASQVRDDAEGTQPPPADTRFVAVEIMIENRTEAALRFQLTDFLLTADDGREVVAVCGGVEPAVTSGELPPGEAVEGWVTFLAPGDFEADQFLFLVGGSARTRVGFGLG